MGKFKKKKLSPAGAMEWASRHLPGLIEKLLNARPTYFLAVPRVWEKFKEGIEQSVQKAPFHKRALFYTSSTIGRWVVRDLQYLSTKKPEMLSTLEKVRKAFDTTVLSGLSRIVLNPVKAAIGLDRCQIAASGAGAIDKGVVDFFAGLNIRIIDLFGMSESSGPATKEESMRTATCSSPDA